MRGIRLHRMMVSAFRGIACPVEFDLSSPLTLVFAPNGTGKTTMCEAAEWLLTGQIERLKEGKDFDPAELRSKFYLDLQTPNVSAALRVGADEKYLDRAAKDHDIRTLFGETPETAKACKPHEFLSLLAPAAAADEAHHLTAINLRQRWVKGTRFLSSDALAALVDTDPETVDRRRQIFADVLGIRHLLDAERLAGKYAGELKTLINALNTSIDQQEREVKDLEQSLAGMEEQRPNAASARSEVDAAQDILGPETIPAGPSNNTSSMDVLLESLTVVHGRRQHELSERAGLLNEIEAQWSTRAQLEVAVAEGRETEAKLASRLAEVDTAGRAAAGVIAENVQQRDARLSELNRLAAARDLLSKRAVTLLEAVQNPLMAGEYQTSLAKLSELLPEARWPDAERRNRESELSTLETQLSFVETEAPRADQVNRQILDLSEKALSDADYAQLETSVQNAEAQARSAQAALDALLQPVDRIQAAAKELLAHDHGFDTQYCPLCAADWKSVDRLRAAIEQVLRGTPELAATAREASTQANQLAADLKTRLTNARAFREKLTALRTESAQLQQRVAWTSIQLARVGGASDQPTKTLPIERAKLAAADALAAFMQAWAEHSSLLTDPDERFADTVIGNVIQTLDGKASRREQDIQFNLATLTKSIEEASATRDKLASEHASLTQQLTELRLRLAEQSEQLTAFHSKWAQLSSDQPPSNATLAKIRSFLQSERERLSKAAAHIEAARSAWSRESRRSRLQQLRLSVDPEVKQRGRLQQRLQIAQRTMAVFNHACTTISRNQVDGLSRVVNPLFARMHANRVFDRISLGQDTDFLHWLANAGDEKLDPSKHFSQGQRQDLALALFLARARGLGGTFFLDEPILHLDDLNRVGLLDIFRAFVLEHHPALNLVITTSSRTLARHMIEKFAAVSPIDASDEGTPPLRVLEMEGNGRDGVEVRQAYPIQ